MSKLSVGIVGLPNVGKSTLFNALLGRQVADASNYPFCTIDPNVGIVEVPDEKLPVLAKVVNTQKIIPAAVEFVDIAGLVKGASQGEGLGNKFLSNIRECHAICHVVRDFSDANIVREGSTDPQGDFEVICAELIIKDLESVDKYLDQHKNDSHEKSSQRYQAATKLKPFLEKGVLAINAAVSSEDHDLLKDLFLLTSKPYFLILNVDESAYQNILAYRHSLNNFHHVIPVCAKLESDLADFSISDKKNYLDNLGITSSGLERVIQAAYQTLGLQSFYTAGEKEVRAWTVKSGSTAPQAASVIHTDFEKGFIMAEVISYSDFVEFGGVIGAKNAGKLRHEGREYCMKPDDVVEFKVNTSNHP